MNQYSTMKNFFIALILFLSILYSLPNIFGSDLSVQISLVGDEPAGQSDLIKVKTHLDNNAIPYKSVELKGKRVLARFENNESQLTAKDLLKNELGRKYVSALNLSPSIPDWLSSLGANAMSLGLDLRGGVHFLLEVDMVAVEKNLS